MRGDGYIYQRGQQWWIGYYREGKLIREPGGASKGKAKDKLKALHRALRDGSYLAPTQRSATVNELLDDLVRHLENKGISSVGKVRAHLKAVRDALGHVKAVELDTAMVETYQQQRRAAGRAAATVNRECELLRQAFRRAANVTPPKVPRAPTIPMLTVDNARQGFLSRADFAALLAAIRDTDLCDFLEFFWWTGMRPGEIRSLTWAMYDVEAGEIHLDPKDAKTRKGRSLAVVGPLREILKRRLKARRLDTPLIFHRVSRGRPGQPVLRFSKMWSKALETAKLPAGLLPYDLRRSAIRNLVRAGVDVSVVMRISGHRTRSTFDRYNIVSTDDVAQAMRKVSGYVATLPTDRKVSGMRTRTERAQSAPRRGRST